MGGRLSLIVRGQHYLLFCPPVCKGSVCFFFLLGGSGYGGPMQGFIRVTWKIQVYQVDVAEDQVIKSAGLALLPLEGCVNNRPVYRSPPLSDGLF